MVDRPAMPFFVLRGDAIEQDPAEKAKRKVPVDFDELCSAFDEASEEHFYYLNLDTGEVEMEMDECLDDDEREALDKKYGPDKYLRVPSADSHESFQDMEHFVQTVKDENLNEKLMIALDGSGAFRRFKNVLSRYPDELDRWYRFEGDRLSDRVMQWLESEGIEVLWPPPIEISEVPPGGLGKIVRIAEEWKDFGPRICIQCKNRRDLYPKLFIISRAPAGRKDALFLTDTLRDKYGVAHHGILAGALGDKRAIVTSAMCGKCGSQDVMFSFP